MKINGVTLQNIRTHKSLVLKMTEQTTVLLGPNASGKTTIVEALFMLATGDSFRAGKIEEIINFEAELGRIKTVISELKDSESGKDEIEVILTRGMVQGKVTAKRLFTVNDIRRRKKDAIGKFYAVVFRPEDMRLVEGSPARRRGFLDTPLKTLHRDYDYALGQYEKILRRRNKLLPQVRDGEQPRTTLEYWNIALLKHGQVIQKFRRDFVQEFREVEFPVNFLIDYQPSVMSQERLDKYAAKEIAAGHTLIGPHKDDFSVTLPIKGEHRNAATYGSRGQQRLGVLWLKFCELEYAANALGEKPLLLLDDILSELDDDSKDLALKVTNDYQSLVTTANPETAEEIAKHASESKIQLLTEAGIEDYDG